MPQYDIIRGISYPDPTSSEPGAERHHQTGEVGVDLTAAGAAAIDEWLAIGAIVEMPPALADRTDAVAAPKRIQGRTVTTGLVVDPAPADEKPATPAAEE